MSGADTDPDQYIEGGSIVWTGRKGLAAGIVGTFVTLLGWMYASFIDLIVTGINGVISGYGSWYAKLLSAPFEAGAGEVEAAIETGRTAITSWGLLAFPMAVLVTVLSLSLILWGVSRFV
ncbi:hypothetical protein [Halolamina salina]|uniref:Uncharacterized protein n=1 Tax=Halolamina salina TaxID=1220023 RepID=A0ABD6B823_9EURY